MAKKLLNLWAETDANIIDDDPTATLEIRNTSTGAGLLATNSAGTGPALTAQTTSVGTPTVAPLRILNSAPSGPAIEFQGKGVISALSGGSILYGVRVKVGDVYGWIPVMVGMGGLGA